MNIPRRLALPTLACLLSSAWAQDPSAWPAPGRQLKIITPTPVGVGSDIFARAYADQLGKVLGIPVIVENRPGALSTLGTAAVAKAAPDGYTLLFSTSNPFTISPFLLSKTTYNPKSDLEPITQALRGGSFIVATPSLPASNLTELVALARKRPGQISFASYGSGSTAHLGFELLQQAADIQLLHVPYKQSAAPDLMAGQVALGFEPPILALPNIKSGRLKAIAYTGARRSPALPEIPTLAESYPGLEVFTWLGFWAPAHTAPEILDKLNKAIVGITHSTELRQLIQDAGLDPIGATPAQTAQAIAQESRIMGQLIKAKGIHVN